MKVFVSYSINDSEQYVLTLLAQRLKDQGAYLDSSYNEYDNILDYNTFSKINKSHLFIGIITKKGSEKQRVFKEWKFAKSKNIPSILLVDETIRLNKTIDNDRNVVKFNRHNPQQAIQIVKDSINRKKTLSKKGSTNSQVAAWILGGVAILAIIGLLSDND